VIFIAIDVLYFLNLGPYNPVFLELFERLIYFFYSLCPEIFKLPESIPPPKFYVDAALTMEELL
tara:strand:- start:401 stop:592 length:192 start_codon:yes stop_codon:yes gene_type:complete